VIKKWSVSILVPIVIMNFFNSRFIYSDDKMEPILNFLKKVKTPPYVSAQFIQKRSVQKIGLNENVSQTSGLFKISTEKSQPKFYWGTKNSQLENLELFVSNGKDLWTYNYVTHYAQKLEANKVGLEFIDIFKKISSLHLYYQLELWEKPNATDNRQLNFTPPIADPESLLLKLTPKQSSRVKSIYCHILKNKGLIKELRIVFDDGSRTQINFSQFNFDKIEEAQFIFTPPKGAHIGK